MIQSNIDSALVFVEYSKVTAIISALVNDEDYRRFQNELMENPERGDVIQGTGGFRKARMRLAGGGKSGGARVIYLYFPERHVIFIGAIYNPQRCSPRHQSPLQAGMMRFLTRLSLSRTCETWPITTWARES